MQRLRPIIVAGMAASALSVLASAAAAPLVVDTGDRPRRPLSALTKRERIDAEIERSAEQERKRKARKAQRAARRRNRS